MKSLDDARLTAILRIVIDCSYLFRSRIARARKIRVLIDYLRLTLKAVLARNPMRAGVERVMGYSVRHAGIGSLQFLFREIFVRGDYYIDTPHDRPLVFDCGANIGLATLYFKWLHPGSEIHAFEPDPNTFTILKENVDGNRLADVHLHNVALTDVAGPLSFFRPDDSLASPLMSVVSSRFGAATSRRVVVDGAPLTNYMDGRMIDLLKMDIEGAEERVLSEAAATGALEQVAEIAVEYHHNLEHRNSRFGPFLQLLENAGYHYQIDAAWKDGPSAGAFQDVLVRARRSRSTDPDSVSRELRVDNIVVPAGSTTP